MTMRTRSPMRPPAAGDLVRVLPEGYFAILVERRGPRAWTASCANGIDLDVPDDLVVPLEHSPGAGAPASFLELLRRVLPGRTYRAAPEGPDASSRRTRARSGAVTGGGPGAPPLDDVDGSG